MLTGKHKLSNFTIRAKRKINDGFTLQKVIDDIVVTSSEYSAFGRDNIQDIRIHYKAKGFLQYQVRIMTGVAVMYSLGRASLEDVKKMIDCPDEKPDLDIVRASPKGLTLLDVTYKDGYLSKAPTFLKEEEFLRGHKARLLEKNIVYENPNNLTDNNIGLLFSD